MQNASALLQGYSKDDRYEAIVNALSEIHGTIRLAKESSGLHAYMACPKCLETYGERELFSKHLAVNLDKYFDISMRLMRGAKGVKGKKAGYAQCMKEHGAFSMVQLNSYPPIEQRGFPGFARKIIRSNPALRTKDAYGKDVPMPPGPTKAVVSLGVDHPCLQFLRHRDYDPVLLYRQFKAEWCEEELPEDPENGRFYGKLPGGWRNTPQGRLIFWSMVQNSRMCWQARYLEAVDSDGCRHGYHPYRMRWEPLPDFGTRKLVKYMTAFGATRNSQLCGFDHVVASIEPGTKPYCVLTEGPLDAARFPNHGLALLGKFMSETQALLISAYFHKVVLAFDQDDAGRDCQQKAETKLRQLGVRTKSFWDGFKLDDANKKTDVGELGYIRCAEQIKNIINF